jgi:hypothetical protein
MSNTTNSEQRREEYRMKKNTKEEKLISLAKEKLVLNSQDLLNLTQSVSCFLEQIDPNLDQHSQKRFLVFRELRNQIMDMWKLSEDWIDTGSTKVIRISHGKGNEKW